MKQSILYFLLITICLTFNPKVKAQSDSIEVGFILANLFVERWQKEKVAFEEKMNELGGKVIFKDCYDQVENQISAAQELIDRDIDALVIIAVDAIATAPIVTFANDAGIPIIAYDRLILYSKLDYYMTFNSIAAGEIMAKAVTNKLSKGNILYLGGPADDHNSVLIRKGVFNILNPLQESYNIYSTQVSSWTELDSYLTLQDYMANSPNLPDAIICAADVLTRGAVNVAEENDALGKIILTGQDADLDICRHISKGFVETTIYKPSEQLAKKAAEEIWKLLHDKKYSLTETTDNGLVQVPSLLLEPVSVTKETLRETVIKDGYYTEEQIFGK